MNRNWEKKLNNYICAGDIDFLGINLGENGIRVKCYRNPIRPQEAKSLCIALLDQKAYCSFVTPIERENGYEEDIRLKQRSDAHMEDLFALLVQMQPDFQTYLEEVRTLSAMPVCTMENHRYASLFYVCVVQHDAAPSKYKFHYLTRMCKDPDRISENITFQDDVYLSYIGQLQNKALDCCAAVIRRYLALSPSHLWTVGTDYDFEKDDRKYKIYVKCDENDNQRILDALEQALTTQQNDFQDELDAVRQYLQFGKHMWIYGFGMCCDMRMKCSLNLYLIP